MPVSHIKVKTIHMKDKEKVLDLDPPSNSLHPGPPATLGAPASQMLKLLKICIGGGTIQKCLVKTSSTFGLRKTYESESIQVAYKEILKIPLSPLPFSHTGFEKN